MLRKAFPESAAVYLPEGTKQRLFMVATTRGLPASVLMRQAILDRLRNEEKEMQEAQSA